MKASIKLSTQKYNFVYSIVYESRRGYQTNKMEMKSIELISNVVVALFSFGSVLHLTLSLAAFSVKMLSRRAKAILQFEMSVH